MQTVLKLRMSYLSAKVSRTIIFKKWIYVQRLRKEVYFPIWSTLLEQLYHPHKHGIKISNEVYTKVKVN